MMMMMMMQVVSLCLTHCDKLDVSSEADAIRLRTTLDTTTKKKSTLFTIAVMGNAKEDEHEQMKLNHLMNMDDRLEVGAMALLVHLEDRKHISELASKELIRTTVLETGSRFNKLFNSNTGKPGLVDLINEPSNKLARERKTLSNRKKILEEALALAYDGM